MRDLEICVFGLGWEFAGVGCETWDFARLRGCGLGGWLRRIFRGASNCDYVIRLGFCVSEMPWGNVGYGCYGRITFLGGY